MFAVWRPAPQSDPSVMFDLSLVLWTFDLSLVLKRKDVMGSRSGKLFFRKTKMGRLAKHLPSFSRMRSENPIFGTLWPEAPFLF